MSESASLTIGILQADKVNEEFQSRHGDYPGMFQSLFDTANDGDSLEFRTYVAADARYPDPRACDAYVITGSAASVYDDLPWIPPLVDFVGRALAAERKIIGICFGHQLIAHFFGGRTEAASGWAVGVHTSEVLGDAPWLDPKLDEFALLSSHKDQVTVLPEGAIPIATNTFCTHAGFVWGDHVLTFQGHPEFQKPYSADVMKMRQDLLGPGTFEKGMASLANDTHENQVGRWILNFCKS